MIKRIRILIELANQVSAFLGALSIGTSAARKIAEQPDAYAYAAKAIGRASVKGTAWASRRGAGAVSSMYRSILKYISTHTKRK